MDATITVIIAAFRAERTIADAIRSALADPYVGQVLVVDDASPDATVAAAQTADDGSGRLEILHQAENAGPAAARNRGFATANRPFIAVLDADDRLLPGRFATLMALPGWDFAADNILFVPAPADAIDLADLPSGRASRPLGLEEFVRRNISIPGRKRSELGFLKPVMRRAFLSAHGLRYDERLRLGEDFVLYVAALAAGARFLLSEQCGYLAIERQDSLSGQHRTTDLAALRDASLALGHTPGLTAAARRDLAAHARSIAVKTAHRRLLDEKAAHGLRRALGSMLAPPALVPGVARAIMHDKLGRGATPLPPKRYLFTADDFISDHAR